MSSEFDLWVASLRLDEPDEGGDVGVAPPGRLEFFREVFEKQGPVPPDVLGAAWLDRELQLARRAVTLIVADLRRTSTLTPTIDVRLVHDSVTAVTYNGGYNTPVILSIREPEATCEVADNLRDHIVEDLGAIWPACPAHGTALDPRPMDGHATWYCRRQDHVVGMIGELPHRS